MAQLMTFLAAITPLFAWFNLWIIRTIYKAGGGDYYGKQWHFAQGCIWAAIWAFAMWLDWRVAIVWPAYHWLLFDGLLNRYSFAHIDTRRPWFYVGKASGSSLDGRLARLRHPELWAGIIKISLLAVCLAAAILL